MGTSPQVDRTADQHTDRQPISSLHLIAAHPGRPAITTTTAADEADPYPPSGHMSHTSLVHHRRTTTGPQHDRERDAP